MTVLTAELKYYYSGGASNSDPDASIGGVKSSVEVGSSINDLFDDVTGDEASAGDTEYRVIYFENTSTDATGLIDPVTWIDSQMDGSDSIEIAVASSKNTAVTSGGNESTPPTGIGSFSAPTTKAGGLTLPGAPYAQNDYCGIAIKRIVPSSTGSDALDSGSIRVEGDTV